MPPVLVVAATVPWHLQELVLWPLAAPLHLPKSTPGTGGWSSCHFLIFDFLLAWGFWSEKHQFEIFLLFPGTQQDAGLVMGVYFSGARAKKAHAGAERLPSANTLGSSCLSHQCLFVLDNEK